MITSSGTPTLGTGSHSLDDTLNVCMFVLRKGGAACDAAAVCCCCCRCAALQMVDTVVRAVNLQM